MTLPTRRKSPGPAGRRRIVRGEAAWCGCANMRFRPGSSVRLAAVAVVAAWGAFLPAPARAYEFVDFATYTTSTTQAVGNACVLYNGTDMSCASTADEGKIRRNPVTRHQLCAH